MTYCIINFYADWETEAAKESLNLDLGFLIIVMEKSF